MKFIILFFYFVTSFNENINANSNLNSKIKLFDKNSICAGYDCRYNNLDNLNNSNFKNKMQLQRISNYFLYKKLLNDLNNQNFSIHEKIKIINKNNFSFNEPKYTYDVKAGGLMKDFDFDFDILS